LQGFRPSRQKQDISIPVLNFYRNFNVLFLPFDPNFGRQNPNLPWFRILYQFRQFDPIESPNTGFGIHPATQWNFIHNSNRHSP